MLDACHKDLVCEFQTALRALKRTGKFRGKWMYRRPRFIEGKIKTTFKNVLISHDTTKVAGKMYYVIGCKLANILHETLTREQRTISKHELEIKRLREQLLKQKEDTNIDKNFHEILGNVGRKLNKEYIIPQCKENIAKYTDEMTPSLLTKISEDDLLKDLHPTVWNFLVLLTQTKAEQDRTQDKIDWNTHFTDFPMSEAQSQTKRLGKLLFFAYTLMHNIYDSCGYPLHVIISDLVDCYSGSETLMNLLCKLGVTVSRSTLKRFMSNIWKYSQTAGKMVNKLKHGAFTITSIDNLDKLFSKVRVRLSKIGDRCWNGTTVSAYNPKPHSLSHQCFSEAGEIKTSNNSAIIVHSEHDYVGRSGSVFMTDDNCHDDGVPVNDKVDHDHDYALGNNVTGEHDYACRGNKTQESSVPNKPKRQKARNLKEMRESSKVTIEKENPMLLTEEQQTQCQYPSDFAMSSEEESTAWQMFEKNVFWYINERSVNRQEKEMVVPGLKCKLFIDTYKQHYNTTEKSNVVFLSVVNAHADKPETVKYVLDELENDLLKNKQYSHMVVVGDAKTFDHLINLKKRHSEKFKWMLPMIGDFHVLMNFQSVLMKLFWDAGLSDMGKLIHNSSTFTSLSACSDFRRTNDFLLQAWEALYTIQIEQFFKWRESESPESLKTDKTVKEVKEAIAEAIKPLFEQRSQMYNDVSEFVEKQKSLIAQLGNLQKEFVDFRKTLCELDETFKFWDSFIHNDCLAYIGLSIANRSGNWNLRMHCLKMMMPLFSVTDKFNYSRIIPKHLADLTTFPRYILDNLREGGFVISLKGTPFASMAVDEAHESTINKDVKGAMSGGGDEMKILADFLPYRAVMLENFKQEIFHQTGSLLHEDLRGSVIDMINDNIKLYMAYVREKGLSFKMCDTLRPFRPLAHLFTNKVASEAQRIDLMTYHQSGENRIRNHIEDVYFNKTSTKTKFQRCNLKTFEVKPTTVAKVRTALKEKESVIGLLKNLVTHSKKTNTPVRDIDQYIELPRAIADEDGFPQKSQKHKATEFYDKRYSKKVKELITNEMKEIPQCAVLEGMFLINMSPLGECQSGTFADYGMYFLQKVIQPYFQIGIKEIHIIFDNYSEKLSPKDIERRRRDKGASESKTYCEIFKTTHLPRKDWMSFIKNRQNKILLCDFLSTFILEHGNVVCGPGQSIVTAGGFQGRKFQNKALYVDNECCKMIEELQSDHEESDSRVNLHIKQSPHTSFLLYSPDTDVYHIGLPLLREKNVIVQLRANKTGDRYLSLHHLRQSLDTDPALKNISPPDRYKYIRMIFLCSGCDYVSSFFKYGKFAFLEIALRFAKFILYGIVDDNTEPESGRFLDCPPFDCQFCNPVSMCQSCTEVLRSSVLGFYSL